MKKNILKPIIIALLLAVLFAGCNNTAAVNSRAAEGNSHASDDGFISDETNNPSCVTVPILMFHDVKTYEGGTWSISAENFRNTLVFLAENGYTPISFGQLINYADGLSGIPENPVCITLDDGYFSNYRNVLPIITELNVPVTVFMTCKTVRQKGIIPSADESELYKLSAAELEIMEASPLVEIQSHTYGLHGVNTTYGEAERDFSLPLKTENKEEYKRIFEKDCELAEKVLTEAGVKSITVFSYPGGKYHEWSEEVLWERGYRVSITSDANHVNTVTKGNPKSLFLLGRMNVNDETTESQLLRYLERK